jgi:hypothetical protein
MASDALAPEERGEPQALRDLRLMDQLVARVFGLADDELADLEEEEKSVYIFEAGEHQQRNEKKKGREKRGGGEWIHTCNSVSVIVCLDTRA